MALFNRIIAFDCHLTPTPVLKDLCGHENVILENIVFVNTVPAGNIVSVLKA